MTIRMKEENKKKLLMMLLELLFYSTCLLFMAFLYNRFTRDYGACFSYNSIIFYIIFIINIVIMLLVPKPANKLVTFLSLGITYFYFISQEIYNRAFGQYYRIKMAISLFNEVMGARESAYEFIHLSDFVPLVVLLLICIAFFVLYFLLEKKEFSTIENAVFFAVKVIVILFLGLDAKNRFVNMQDEINLMNNDMGQFLYTDDYYLFDMIPSSTDFVKRFGLSTFLYRDIDSIIHQRELKKEELQEISEFLSDRKEKLSENSYTGLFEDKNVIFIQIESLIDIAINEKLTPNLYKIKNNCLKIEDFNTPALPGSTSDTEFMANTSLIPNSIEEANCYHFAKNCYPVTLASIFNENGYSTYAYHNNYGSYYNRSVVFANFGYNEFFDCSKLGVGDCTPDSIVAKNLAWMHSGKEKFCDYWVTYSGHQPYNYDTVAVSEENIQRIHEVYPNLTEEYAAYFSKMMDTDAAIGLYMNELEYQGLLADTVIVVYGDHIVKGLDFSENAEFYQLTGIKYQDENTYTDLFLYNPNISAETYTKTATVLDLLPTIANLWSIDIDNRKILGHDIFDEDYTGFYFSEWDRWKTDNYYYDTGADFYEFIMEYDKNKAIEEMTYYLKEKKYSRQILQSNFFSK